MSRIFSAELLKLRTTRTFLVLALAAIVLEALVTVVFALLVKESERNIGRELLNVSGFAQTFALIVGILIVTNEYRHGTITPTLLVVPDRARLLVAKLGVGVAGGLGLGVVCGVVNVALGLLILAARGIDSGVGFGDIAGPLAGGIVGVALYAGIGVGLGAVIRDQVGAIVASLVWLFVGEPALSAIPTVGDWIADYGPGGASAALAARTFGDDPTLGQLPGGVLLAAYCAIFAVAGVVLMRRRDVGG